MERDLLEGVSSERERVRNMYICTYMALSHSINDNESCAELLLERMDNVSINGADKSGR